MFPQESRCRMDKPQAPPEFVQHRFVNNQMGCPRSFGGERRLRQTERVAVHAGWKPSEICSKMSGRPYYAARLQTLSKPAPISVYWVTKQLDHGGDRMDPDEPHAERIRGPAQS